MKIRSESPADLDKIYDFIKTAFATADFKDGTEQDYADCLRDSPGYIPQLALVAEDNAGNLLGHVMFTHISVDEEDKKRPALMLAPLSVALECRKRGVGSALVRHGLKLATDMGHRLVFLAGDRNYYGRFGFEPVLHYGLECNFEVPPEHVLNILVRQLVPGGLEGVKGVIQFPAP